MALVRPGDGPAGIGLARHDGDGRVRAAGQAVRRSLPEADLSELVVAASDPHRLLIAGDGTLTTVETREIDGHVVAWTVDGDAPDTEECTR
ncbi:hypothetical protein [Actinomadura sp. CNU-125]|uniref:hypothetical protein n=1 Tax=Actinomadura sp. CNU-125 TaxID=1904961 RepID=UPI00130135B1